MHTVPQNKKDPLRGPDARSVEGGSHIHTNNKEAGSEQEASFQSLANS